MINLRKAQIADAAAIGRVHVDTWRSTYSGIVPEDYLAQLSYTDVTLTGAVELDNFGPLPLKP